MRLIERRILVTGGGSGIGLALARALATGNRVVVAGRDETKLEGARAAIPTLETVRLDVTDEEDAARAVAEIQARFGALDVLINCAGVMHAGPLDGPGAERRAAQDVEINLLGTIRMTRLALPMLRASDDGAVVMLSSALALVSSPGMAVYAATKAAVHSLARSLRAELKRQVKVFDVLPPWTDSDLSREVPGAKVTPERVARDIVEDMQRERLEIRIGRIKQLAVIERISPSWADSIAARATGSPNA
jgi:uncharacterized oxidoreductase